MRSSSEEGEEEGLEVVQGAERLEVFKALGVVWLQLGGSERLGGRCTGVCYLSTSDQSHLLQGESEKVRVKDQNPERKNNRDPILCSAFKL